MGAVRDRCSTLVYQKNAATKVQAGPTTEIMFSQDLAFWFLRIAAISDFRALRIFSV